MNKESTITTGKECATKTQTNGHGKGKREPKKPREHYRLRTRLIHGSFATGRWIERFRRPNKSTDAIVLGARHVEQRGAIRLRRAAERFTQT